MSDAYGSNKPHMDARLQGTQLLTAIASQKTKFYFDFTFDCYFNGVEFYAWDSAKGDNVTLWTEYYAGPYGWKRYKKFGKNFNIYPNSVQKYILFPTEPNPYIRLVIEYDNKAVTDTDFSLNLFTFADRELVNTSILAEGEDW